MVLSDRAQPGPRKCSPGDTVKALSMAVGWAAWIAAMNPCPFQTRAALFYVKKALDS